MSYKVKKDNDEIPENRGAKRKYPFADMKAVNDYFDVPTKDASLNTLCTAARHWSHKLGWKFTVRRIDGDGCHRVIRTS